MYSGLTAMCPHPLERSVRLASKSEKTADVLCCNLEHGLLSSIIFLVFCMASDQNIIALVSSDNCIHVSCEIQSSAANFVPHQSVKEPQLLQRPNVEGGGASAAAAVFDTKCPVMDRIGHLTSSTVQWGK